MAAGQVVSVRFSQEFADGQWICGAASHVRAVDLPARLGGDEFVVVLDQVGSEVAKVRAAHILCSVLDLGLAERGAGPAVSISPGLCISGAAEMQTTLTRADRSLYEAKRGGRNEFVLASGSDGAVDVR